MKSDSKLWTVKYSLINITYFAAFFGVHACASVYLLDKGFSNTLIGILLAVSNVLSVLTQSYVAGVIDRGGKITNRTVVIISSVAIIVLSGLLPAIDGSVAAVFAVYTMIYLIQMAYQPMIIAMSFEYMKAGCKLNFGLARGLGSAGFAVSSAIMGGRIESFGPDIIVWFDIAVLLFAIVVLLTFKKPSEVSGQENVDDDSATAKGARETGEVHNNLLDFIRNYPMFMLMLVAVAFLFFGHNILNDYLIQIIRSLGGAETDLGYANFLQAILELPVMGLIVVIMKKFSAGQLMMFSGVIFFVKILVMFLATGLAGMYISQACQLGAYALLIPASAYYASDVMEERDQVKGQAYINCAITISGVFSNLIAGRVLDVSGVKVTLAIGCVVTLLGSVTMIIAIKRGKKRI